MTGNVSVADPANSLPAPVVAELLANGAPHLDGLSASAAILPPTEQGGGTFRVGAVTVKGARYRINVGNVGGGASFALSLAGEMSFPLPCGAGERRSNKTEHY